MVASSRFGYNYRAIIGLLRHYHLIIVIRSVSNQMDPHYPCLMMGPQLSGWTKSGRQLIAAEVVLFFKKKKGTKKKKEKTLTTIQNTGSSRELYYKRHKKK